MSNSREQGLVTNHFVNYHEGEVTLGAFVEMLYDCDGYESHERLLQFILLTF